MVKEFKVFYGDEPATQEQLDAIEEIVVEQEIGLAWEAKIKIPICIGEDGAWREEDEPAYAEFERVRVEVRLGEGDWVPLIDGRITNQDPGLSAEPGNSTLVLTIQDDTTLLHQLSSSEGFAGQSDSEIANTIFAQAGFGGLVDVDDTGAPPDANAVIQQEGTAMELLRSFMTRHPDHYAYVLPGTAVGTSDCYFKKLPESPDPELPGLILTGPERNISGFNVQRMSNGAAQFEGSSLNSSDMTISTGTSSSADAAPPEGEGATLATDQLRMRRLPPGMGDHTDMAAAAEAAALSSSFTVRAEGAVLSSCFGTVLSPYRMINASVSNSRYSTNYVIFKVTHTLGISEYTQSFSVRGNAVSPENSPSASAPAASASVGGSASVSFNIQVGIV